jgi:hypothetical protein
MNELVTINPGSCDGNAVEEVNLLTTGEEGYLRSSAKCYWAHAWQGQNSELQTRRALASESSALKRDRDALSLERPRNEHLEQWAIPAGSVRLSDAKHARDGYIQENDHIKLADDWIAPQGGGYIASPLSAERPHKIQRQNNAHIELSVIGHASKDDGPTTSLPSQEVSRIEQGISIEAQDFLRQENVQPQEDVTARRSDLWVSYPPETLEHTTINQGALGTVFVILRVDTAGGIGNRTVKELLGVELDSMVHHLGKTVQEALTSTTQQAAKDVVETKAKSEQYQREPENRPSSDPTGLFSSEVTNSQCSACDMSCSDSELTDISVSSPCTLSETQAVVLPPEEKSSRGIRVTGRRTTPFEREYLVAWKESWVRESKIRSFLVSTRLGRLSILH